MSLLVEKCAGGNHQIGTRYPFKYRLDGTEVEFCTASCFKNWSREQEWQLRHPTMRSVCEPAPATS